MNFSELQNISNEVQDLLDEMEKDGSADKFRQAEALAAEAQQSPAFQKLVTSYNLFRVQPQLTPQQLLQQAQLQAANNGQN